MKALRNIAFIFLSIVYLQTSAQTKAEKQAAKTADIKAMIDGQRFDFVAQYATPQGGGRRYLSSTYDLKVRKDSLIVYLPYFGRAYFDVPYNPTDGGIKFTSTNFGYKVTQKKNGSWDILIQPADSKYYQRINLSVSTSGNASASFVITNKSFISFDGYIESPDKRKD